MKADQVPLQNALGQRRTRDLVLRQHRFHGLFELESVSWHGGRHDADFLVFDNDLLTAEKEGFSHNKPLDVYACGKKLN